ncbi:MAG: F0F1 ATP synthase subunit epsilon [Rhizobiaceae bacterium]
MSNAFNFELVSPERLLFSEQVTAVVVPGSDGYFTVMANHAPLMTTIRPGVVEATLASGGTKKLFVRGGFVDVAGSSFTLLAEQAMPLEDLNVDVIASQIKDAEDDVADARSDAKKEAATLKLNQLKELKAALGH